MKTPMSRFQIHDDLTAPEGSQPLLRGALATGGQLPNVLGVLAGAPAALRGYARLRSELRHGNLQATTLERIALAVAEHHGSAPSLALHERAARRAGMRLDDIALAREWDSIDPRDAALLHYLLKVDISDFDVRGTPRSCITSSRSSPSATRPPHTCTRRRASSDGRTSSCSRPSRSSRSRASRRW